MNFMYFHMSCDFTFYFTASNQTTTFTLSSLMCVFLLNCLELENDLQDETCRSVMPINYII